MSQELVISSNPIETTVAIVENDRLVEIYVEHHARKAITGSIYKGRVSRVLPGMQSAFVALGLKRDAFLYVTDVLDPADALEDDPDAGPLAAQALPDEPDAPAANGERGEDSESEPAQGAAEPNRRRRSRRRGSRRQQPGDEAPAGAAEPTEPAAAVLPGESLAKYGADSGPESDDGPDPAADANAPGEDPVPGPADGETEDVAATGATPARRRRGGRRRRSGRQARGDGASPEAREAPPAGEASPPEADSAAVLPGESLAKYDRGGDGKNGDTDPPAAAGPAGPDEARGSGAADAEAGPAAATGPADSEPRARSASVSAPSLLAELRWRNLFKWGRRKGEDEAPAAETVPDVPERPAKRRAAEGRKEAGPGRGQPAAGKRKRSPRKPPAAKRSSERRPPRRDDAPRRQRQPAPEANIKDLLKDNQEVIVQVVKEPVGTKGARITSHVSLPGRYMVYMTTAAHNGVARTIRPEAERNRLRKIVDRCAADKPGGFVVRTAGRGVSQEDLEADMEFLYQLWKDIQEKAEKRKAPAKLHSDLDIVERKLRDHLGQDYKAIWVDSEDEYQRIVRFVERFQPALLDRVKLYTRREPIYDSFGVAKDLEKAMRPKVWLKSGGYLVINQTEALVAIDVNTGRYTGKSDRLEDTVLKTNLEAAEEIVRQLRLRDLGGIIVIDFIDMEDRKHRKQVEQVLQDALRQTRSPSRLLPFNDFGLVVITRKSVRQSLERSLCMPCPVCSGAGTVKSSDTVVSEIFAAASRRAANGKRKSAGPSKDITLRVHPEIAKSLKHKSASHLEDLEQALGTHVLIRGDSSMHPEKFDFD